MDNYRRTAGLETRKRQRPTRKKGLLEMIKRVFSYERSAGIVAVSTVPFVTERWKDGEREILSFMVTLPCWVSEKKILEGINDGFGWLAEETEEKV